VNRAIILSIGLVGLLLGFQNCTPFSSTQGFGDPTISRASSAGNGDPYTGIAGKSGVYAAFDFGTVCANRPPGMNSPFEFDVVSTMYYDAENLVAFVEDSCTQQTREIEFENVQSFYFANSILDHEGTLYEFNKDLTNITRPRPGGGSAPPALDTGDGEGGAPGMGPVGGLISKNLDTAPEAITVLTCTTTTFEGQGFQADFIVQRRSDETYTVSTFSLERGFRTHSDESASINVNQRNKLSFRSGDGRLNIEVNLNSGSGTYRDGETRFTLADGTQLERKTNCLLTHSLLAEAAQMLASQSQQSEQYAQHNHQQDHNGRHHRKSRHEKSHMN